MAVNQRKHGDVFEQKGDENPTLEEMDLLSKIYALFIEEKGLSEEFRDFMDEGVKILINTENVGFIN